MLNIAIKSPQSLFIIFAFLLLWPSSAGATGAVGSASATEIVITYQHPGLTAESHFGGKKYRICVRPYNGTQNCKTTDNQSIGFNQLQVGAYYEIRVYCHCRGTGPFGTAWTRTILSVEWRHVAPAPPTLPQIVRLRSVTTGQCLYPNNDLLYSGACVSSSLMSFAIEPVPNGTQIRHLPSNRCIHGSFPLPNSAVVMAQCGKIGTRIQVRPYVNGRFRLDITGTQDQVFGYPPVSGFAGCLRPPPAQGGQATKQHCHWEPWLEEDMFYLDPA